MGKRTRFSGFLASAAAGAALAAACSTSPPPAEPADNSVAKRQPLSPDGAERLIPIRFIQMLQNAGDPDNASWASVLLSVQNGNQTWKAAGVQFWIRSIERFVMPHFWDMTLWASPQPWSAVKAELVGAGTPFPNAPSDAWVDNGFNKTKADWLRAVAAVYAEQNEVTVWIKKQGDGGHFCRFPAEGRDCVWHGPGMGTEPYKCGSHELGHYLGLSHSWLVDTYNDPSTQQPWNLSDRWDMVYKPGTSGLNPNTYYTFREQAAVDEASLRLIHAVPSTAHPPDADNCRDGAGGMQACDIGASPGYFETLSTGAAGMKGMGFPHPGDDGANTMTYRGNFGTGPRDVSDSQIEIVRKYLRWDEPFAASQHTLIYSGFTHPVGVDSGYSTRLGSWNQRQPAAKFDFDGDGKRDIGVWIPPHQLGLTGEFIVLLSTNSFLQISGLYLDVPLGGLGDTPIPADYNGDGRTDIAVFQPGGGINRNNPADTAGYWRWCPTANPAQSTTCAAPTVIHYGERYDVPQPGLDFDGTPPDGLAIYRPKNATWYFKELSWGSSRAVVLSTANSGAVLLAGNYDCDDNADLAVYEPTTAKFKLVRSELNWDAAQAITRQFSTNFIPQGSGTPTQVGGVVPVAGQQYRRYCQVGQYWVAKSRLSAALMFPQDGTWNMMMDPVGSATVNSCVFGTGSQMPIGGTDWNADGQSDMAFYNGYTYNNSLLTLFAKNTTWSGCTGSVTYRLDPGGAQRRRARIYSVSDMTGDGINDLMIVDPDQGVLRWATSESQYSTENSRTFGNTWMEVL